MKGRTALITFAMALALGISSLWQWFPSPREAGYVFVRSWGEPGAGPRGLRYPTGVAVDPENLRQALAGQFRVSLEAVPKTYGEFLLMLKERGAGFCINTGFLIVSKIGIPGEPHKKLSAGSFRPVTPREMVGLRSRADYCMAC